MPTSFEAALDTLVRAPVPAWIEQLQGETAFAAEEENFAASDRGDQSEDTSALEEAFRKGEASGRAVAMAEHADHMAVREKLELALNGLNAETAKALETALAETVVSLCEQVIGPALINQGALAARCAKAIAALGEAPSRLTLHLHPEDIEAVQKIDREGVKIHADPSLKRGSIRLESPNGIVSDTPKDWHRILREALGQ